MSLLQTDDDDEVVVSHKPFWGTNGRVFQTEDEEETAAGGTGAVKGRGRGQERERDQGRERTIRNDNEENDETMCDRLHVQSEDDVKFNKTVVATTDYHDVDKKEVVHYRPCKGTQKKGFQTQDQETATGSTAAVRRRGRGRGKGKGWGRVRCWGRLSRNDKEENEETIDKRLYVQSDNEVVFSKGKIKRGVQTDGEEETVNHWPCRGINKRVQTDDDDEVAVSHKPLWGNDGR
uniref:Uncharacterized protein n=1 Tax=Amphimedon queenslandica TaxID=400682 RepID=A0A1X7VRD5_AMPQE